MRKISTAIAALATLTLAAPASAGEILLNGWSWDAGNDDRYYSDGTVNVRVSAWSIDGNGIIQDSDLDRYSYGIGIDNDGSDQHTIDNSGWRDFLLFQFDQSVVLDEAYFNNDIWHGFSDTDATIGYGDSPYAWNSALPINGLPFVSTPDLYSSNTSDYGDSERGINPDGYQGDFWLIGASFNNPDLNYTWRDGWEGFDSFKLKKISYDLAPPPGVPEPSTWLMLILGFGLVGGVMRRDKRKVEAALA